MTKKDQLLAPAPSGACAVRREKALRGWRSQIADGRVFELRSKSTRYPPPCGLIINAKSRYDRFMVAVDEFGCIGDGLYRRRHNPNIYIPGIRYSQFTSRRVVRRRPDLERFTEDDLALIRYGYAVEFNGKINGYSMPSIPLAVPAEWTVFWTPPYSNGFPYFSPTEREEKIIAGAWHFRHHGGPRHLGYKYGHVVATRHTGERLDRVRKVVLRHLPDLVETKVNVIRWIDEAGQVCTTAEYDSPCPALGDGRTTIIETPQGSIISCTSRNPVRHQQDKARGPEARDASNEAGGGRGLSGGQR